MDKSLLVAGILTSGMAAYHFWLPFAFHWSDVLKSAPALQWGTLLINACFSFLLLAGGLMTIAIAVAREPRDRTGTWVLVTMAAFWFFNAAYQVIAPMPLPKPVASLSWAFLGFAVIVMLLYAEAVWRPGRKPAGP